MGDALNFKHLPSGMPFHQFKDECKKLMGGLLMPKDFYYSQYGIYCKSKDSSNG